MSLGTVSSGGEADVKSQYKVKTECAGARRHEDGGIIGGLRRRWRIAAISAAVTVAVALGTRESGAQQRIMLANSAHTTTVTVMVGKSEDVHIDQSLVDITVGDPEVADVNPLTDHALSILGKKIGATRVTIYGEGKKIVGIFDVNVAYDVSRLNTEIARIAGSGIRVSSVNGRILLSGTVADAVTLDKAVMVARQFVPDVINTVQVLQAQQIMLEVRFIEASRQASRELGVQWNMFGSGAVANVGNQVAPAQLPITSAGGSFQQPGVNTGGLNVGSTSSTISSAVSAGVLSGVAPFGFLVGQLVGGKNSLDVSINALEQKGLARSLAEPNLVALSGDTASFLAGGEFPVPVPGALGVVSIDYKPYGVGLAFTPTVLRDGLINLVIKPEVSQLDTSNPVQVAGISVPPLIVRRASTTIELRDGQSFMLGGLLQNQSTTAQDQLPWVGDTPVLGALFRSSQYQKNETDLVILVTPHIVHPIAPSAPIRTPLDSSLPANDIDFFLMGQAEVSPALARLAIGAANRPYVGHILDLPRTGGAYVSARN
ncbi:MAG: type II and III secretion system protein family protein [Xanthobacteraceae bacterium]